MKRSGQDEPPCTAGRRVSHDWAARHFGGIVAWSLNALRPSTRGINSF
jgi:hypothetical protein